MRAAWFGLILLLSLFTYLLAQDGPAGGGGETKCPGGQIFVECGSACNITCNEPDPVCTEQCVARCQCPEKQIWHDQRCMDKMDCPGSQCQRQLANLEDANLKGRVKALLEDEDATTEDIKALFDELKALTNVHIGKCLEILSDKQTAGGSCTEEDVADVVCANPDPRAALENCREVKCAALVAVLTDDDCFSEDEQKIKERRALAAFLADDPDCHVKVAEIPDDALFSLGEDITMFLEDMDDVQTVLDKLKERKVLPILSCEAKKDLAQKSFEKAEVAAALDSGTIENTTADVLIHFLPYFNPEMCDAVIKKGMDYLIANPDMWKVLNFECREEDDPAFLHRDEQEANRKKRAIGEEDAKVEELKDHLAERDYENCGFSCGKAVAKAVLARIQVEVDANEDPCGLAIQKMGDLYKCLTDKSKESLFKCDITDACIDSFNSGVTRLFEKAGCDKSQSSNCEVWCDDESLSSMTKEQVCALPDGDKVDCIKVKACYNKLAGPLSKCDVIPQEILEESRKENGNIRLSDVDNSDFMEAIKEVAEKRKEDRDKKEQAILEADARNKVKDKTATELAAEPTTLLDNFQGVNPKIKKDAAETFVADTTPEAIKDYLNEKPRDPKEMKRLVQQMTDNGVTFSELPPLVKVLSTKAYIGQEGTDIEGLCVLDDLNYEHDERKAKELSDALIMELEKQAASNDTKEIFEYIDPEMDKSCLLNVDETNVEDLPDETRGEIVDKICDPKLLSRFDRHELCKAFLEAEDKDLDVESTTFVAGDEEIKGMSCLLHIIDFDQVLDKATDDFLVLLFLKCAPHPACWPDNILKNINKILERLQNVDMTMYEVTALTLFLGMDENEEDETLETLSALIYDLSETIGEAKEECEETKQVMQRDAESSDKAADRQAEMDTSLKEKHKEMLDTLNALEDNRRRKRSSGMPTRYKRQVTYTCSYIQSLKESVTLLSVTELESIDDTEFLNCVQEFGKYEYDSDSHYTTLLERSLTSLTLERCSITIDDITTLENLVYGLSSDDLACMTFDDDLLFNFGIRDGWSSDQMEAIVLSYLSTAGVSENSLTADHLLMMKNTICGISNIGDITPVNFFEVSASLGDLSASSMTTDCVTEFVLLLKDDTAFGPVNTWDSVDFSDVGIFVGGLTGEELNSLDQEKIDEISNDAISLIHPDELAKVSVTWIGYLNRDQAQSVTQNQIDELDDEQEEQLGKQIYGDDYVIIDDDDGDNGGDDNDSGVSHLTVSMAMLMVSLFGALWL